MDRLILKKLKKDSKVYKKTAVLLLMALSDSESDDSDDDEALAMSYLGLAKQKDAELSWAKTYTNGWNWQTFHYSHLFHYGKVYTLTEQFHLLQIPKQST